MKLTGEVREAIEKTFLDGKIYLRLRNTNKEIKI